MDPFLGQIVLFSFPFTPHNWAQCNGQLLKITQNQALFSLLGTRYGGDGRTTFALPDLRGRAPIHQGRGPQLAPQEMATRTAVRGAGGAETPLTVGAIAMNYCIALQGIYPSRN